MEKKTSSACSHRKILRESILFCVYDDILSFEIVISLMNVCKRIFRLILTWFLYMFEISSNSTDDLSNKRNTLKVNKDY